MRVLFVANNPPVNASDFREPMCETTLSGRVFRSWARLLGLDRPQVINLLDVPTEGNRPLKMSDFSEERLKWLEDMIFWNDRVIALGSFPAKIVAKFKDKFYHLPHPSPHNRLLNDPALVVERLEGCFHFLYGENLARDKSLVWLPAFRRYEGFYLRRAS